MVERFPCAICGEESWTEIGKRRYAASDKNDVDAYTRKRLEVLFHVWLEDVETITLSSLACRACGFVCYSPRPTPDDVRNKYRWIEARGQDYGVGEEEWVVEDRARRLVNAVRVSSSGRPMNILDFGGGDGRLMGLFLKEGHRVWLVDYNRAPIPGVRKLADTIEGMGDDHPLFDLIICNHVIEHVARPGAVIVELAQRLAPEGRLFIEVPLEIWRRAPLPTEPVTHVNFFVRGSLERLLAMAGLRTMGSRLAPSRHPSGAILPAVRALGRKARPGERAASQVASGYAEVQSYLHPRLPTRLKRCWLLRANAGRGAASRFKRVLRLDR